MLIGWGLYSITLHRFVNYSYICLNIRNTWKCYKKTYRYDVCYVISDMYTVVDFSCFYVLSCIGVIRNEIYIANFTLNFSVRNVSKCVQFSCFSEKV